MVRRLPSLRRARLLTGGLVLALVVGTAAPSLADDHDDVKAKQQQAKQHQQDVQAGIKEAQADLGESSAAAAKAGKQLIRAETQLQTARATLSATQVKLAKAKVADATTKAALSVAEQQLDATTAAVTSAEKQVADQRAAVGRLAAQSVQHADPQVVGLVALMQADDPTSLSTEIQAVGNVLDRQDHTLAQYRDAVSSLGVQKANQKQARDEVAQRRQEAAANLEQQQTLTDKAADQEKSVNSLVGQRAAARDAAKQAKHDDEGQLEALKKENEKVKDLIDKLAAQATSYANDGPLMPPADGPVTSPFGYRVHPIYGYYSLHDGTDFGIPCGTPLRASGNGKVVQEYFQTAWGNRLILDLGTVGGHAVSVIYNHMSGYKAHTGDTVNRGDVVGYSGTTGWSTGCHLHFTVMVDGQPQDPMKWF